MMSMNVAVVKTGTERRLSDVFALARGRLPGDGRVAEVRQAAIATYERLGLPHRRIEEWKYTDLRMLMREVLPLAPTPDAAALARAREALSSVAMAGAQKLVLVDGVIVPELSELRVSELGVSVRTLRDILDDAGNAARADLLLSEASDAMISLNAAMATDGVVIDIADGAVLKTPIQIVHVAVAPKASSFTRSHVRIGNGARATLVESFVAAGAAQGYQAH